MDYKSAGLSDSEYERINELLEREPNSLETQLIGVMWSEHCSYKSTKRLLKTYPSTGRYVLQGQGENAGVVDVGEGWGLAFKVESHNHPSAVAPFQGAATGVGGIIRDIIAMGARPTASMDGLFFGDPSLKKTENLSKGIVEGIGAYGNAVGVPVVGGKTFYSPCYTDNPLVNAFCAGFVRLDKMASSQTAKSGDFAVLLGSKTGRDGIAGASFASRELDEDSKASKPQIQIGDPFEEKLLIECCLDLLDKDLIASMQDMGAAGILSSSSEIAHKSGCGIDINVEMIPLREKGMEPWEIFLSESQERMLLIVEKDKLDPVFALAAHYGLDCAVIGNMTDSGRYRVYDRGELIADLPTSILGNAPEAVWPSAAPDDSGSGSADRAALASKDPESDLLSLISCHNGRSKHWIWEQYDSMVQLHTIEGPGSPVAAVEVPDTKRACLLTMEAEPYKCRTDPYIGASETMALSLRGLWVAGAEVLGMTNCLNFASPEVPEKFYELEQSIKGLADTCRDLDCPVVSGNVSLYNETASGQIYPTPLVVTAGLVKDRDSRLPSGKASSGDSLYIVGGPCGSLGASRYQVMKEGGPKGVTVLPDHDNEKAFRERALMTAENGAASSGRAVAGGGLAIALANEVLASGCGLSVKTDISVPPEEILFSEGGARAVYAVPAEKEKGFEKIWKGFPCIKAGTFGGTVYEWQDMFRIDIARLKKAFMEGSC
ncbi:MAG TPA: phosphoribosylformylglycinamidine synthase subunit PurL [Synergistaceae bacterium]|nr:phosphoribosylformylglycinamidine synthase subunit PurL [Synergistaceae bacterium]HPX03132.1 phosphoribosylformylglycinamidine synthase subunit PurL [Synergistaceae bacterium]HQA54008.1 phosphoribosylformylglycinamidine synthase subunit PurL [Synergistaceae bacterium]